MKPGVQSLPLLLLCLLAGCPNSGESASVEKAPPEPETIQGLRPNGTVAVEYTLAKDANGQSVQHGKITYFYPDGKKALEGEYDHGQPVGTWKEWDPERKLHEIPFEKGAQINVMIEVGLKRRARKRAQIVE